MCNLPNILSMSRILLILPLIVSLINGVFNWALGIFIIAALTDAADGMLARLRQQRTIIGSYLDPVADKLLMASSFLSLAILDLIPGWLTVLVISRDVLIMGGLLLLFFLAKVPEIRPSLASKVTTLLQLLTIIIVLSSQVRSVWPSLMIILIWATAVFTAFSGIQYVKIGIELFKQRTKNEMP